MWFRNCFILASAGFIGVSSASAGGPSAAEKLWLDLTAKRNQLLAFHQEFNVSRTFKGNAEDQSSTWRIVLDMHDVRWRESFVSGSCDCLTIFDGHDAWDMQVGNDEYVESHPKTKDSPLPSPYSVAAPDWSKAVETERRPCAPPAIMHECVLITVPIQRRRISYRSPTEETDGLGGAKQFLIDTVNGMLISAASREIADNRHLRYEIQTSYVMEKGRPAAESDDTLFTRPAAFSHLVKEFKEMDAAALRKQLVGHPAPELALKDMQGNAIALSVLRGKTVLLDFWATWCAPCRADAPSLNKLFLKYHDNNLVVVGISVSETREVVEKYLSKSPDSFPIALTTENDLPHIYKVEEFPTYMVINPDGVVSTVVAGDRGFYDLRNALRKAGLETD